MSHIGVVCNRKLGIVRVINPDHEWELDIEILNENEYLLRVPKHQFGVSDQKDAMTLDQVQRVLEVFAP